MNRSLWSAICATPFITIAAFAAPAGQTATPATSSKPANDTITVPYGTVTAEMTITAKGFVTATITSDMFEVEAGKLAEKLAQSPGVKSFASQMVQAHTATTKKLKDILANNKIAIPLPAHLDDRRQALIKDLQGTKGADFDHHYLTQQETAHEESELVMRGYSQDGDTPAIKSLAAATLPMLQDHLQTIRKLESDPKTNS